MTTINILLTGPTGYIGGSVLSALLRHPRLDEFNITVLVRSEEKACRFRDISVTPVVGSYDNSTLLKDLASQADVVITCVDSGSLTATRAILGGAKKRHRETAAAPILIHTPEQVHYTSLFSDCFQNTVTPAVLIDDAQGNYPSNKIYSDFNIHMLESCSRTQPHREVDLAIMETGEEEYIKTCIICPGLVYGTARTRLVCLGLQNPHSQVITAFINAGIDRQQGGMIGKGLNVWSHVHIEDLACLYMHMFDAAFSPCRLYVGRIGVYFTENGECKVWEISQEVAKELGARGFGGCQQPSPKQS